MTITIPAARRQIKSGSRPINLNRDIPKVLQLLELVFGESLRGDSRQMAQSVGIDAPPFMYRLNLGMTRLAPGFVWEENGRIIGNATLIRTKSANRYHVVNVAVHPDHRRRGIARMLMESIMEMVQHEGGHTIMLQVVKDNKPAIDLYKSLRFRALGSVTSWYSAVSRIQAIPASVGLQEPLSIRELKRSEWRSAYNLDLLSLPSDLNWPEPITDDAYQTGFFRQVSHFMNGRQVETWVTTDEQNQLTGLAQIISDWGRFHTVHVRIHPQWHGVVERPLIAKVSRRLKYLPRRNVRLDHVDNHEEINELLPAANFQARRTLTHMKLQV
jgi:GNAT superfamily N-acetyltransferase